MTELAIREPSAVLPFGNRAPLSVAPDLDSWLQVMSDVVKLAEYICDTQFVPRAYRGNAPAAAAAILTGRELGLPPMTALRHVQVVEGSPSLSAEYKRARVLAAGHDLDIIELNTTRCKVVGRRKGKPPLEITFSMDDARRGGLVRARGGWETRPRRMLFARASTEVCDFLFTDITNGLPTTELLEEGGGEEGDFGGYVESPSQLPPVPAGEQPKPRTARRRQAAPDASPAQAAPPVAAPATPVQQGAGEALPPLPGEEEPAPAVPAESAPAAGAAPDDTDYDTPGTATRGKGGQLTALWTILSTDFGFGDDEKPQARAVCEHIINRDLVGGTTGNLSYSEAKTVLDTLAHWKAQADGRGDHPRDYLIATMAAQDGARDGE